MQTYQITAPDGRSFKLTGESPPTEAELEQIFSANFTTEDLLNESQNFPAQNPEAHKSAFAMEYISVMTGEEVNESNYKVLSKTLGYTGDTAVDFDKISSHLESTRAEEQKLKEESGLKKTGKTFAGGATGAVYNSAEGITKQLAILKERLAVTGEAFVTEEDSFQERMEKLGGFEQLRKDAKLIQSITGDYNFGAQEMLQLQKTNKNIQFGEINEKEKIQVQSLINKWRGVVAQSEHSKHSRSRQTKETFSRVKNSKLNKLSKWIGEQGKYNEDFYKVDPDFAATLFGQIVSGAGQLTVQVPATMLNPAFGAAVMEGQIFQGATDDYYETLGIDPNDATPEQQQEAFMIGLANAVPGALLERIGIDAALSKVFKGGQRLTMQEALKRMIASGASEGTTEALQGILQDALASGTFDEDREVVTGDGFQRRINEFLVGSILGSGTSATLSTLEATEQKLKSPTGIPYSKQETDALNEIISPEEQQQAIAQQNLNEDAKQMLTTDESPTTKQVVNQDEVATDEQIEQAAKENSGAIVPIPVGAIQREIEGKDPAAIEKVEQDRERTEEIASKTTFGRSTRANADDQLLLKDNGFKQAAADTFSITQQKLDKLIQPISTRIKKISPKIYGRLQSFELSNNQRTSSRIQAVEPFVQGMKSLKKKSKKMYEEVSASLFSGNFENAQNEILKADEKYDLGLGNTGANVIETLKEIHKEAKEVEYKLGYLENYFPRVVKDYRELQRFFGKKPMGDIEQKIYAHEQKTGKKLDPWEREEFINNLVSGKAKGQGGIGNMKKRSIETVTPDMLRLYDNAEDSLISYIRIMTNNIEKQRIFGKPKKKKPKKGQLQLPAEDIDSMLGAQGTPDRSLGEMLNEFIEESDSAIEPDQQLELLNLLQARFDGGEQTPNVISQTFRNIVYTGLLGNPISAITQIEDLSINAYKNGINTVDGFIQRDITIDDLGLRNFINLDVSQARSTSKMLGAVLKISGFSAIDNFGKNAYLNATFSRLKTESDEYFNEQTDIYGKEFVTKLKQQLEADVVGSEVTQVLFNELSQVQPITKLEMPEVYLNNPNARLFYMFKSYLIKRMDLIRKEAFTEMQQGRVGNGLKNMMLMSFMFTLGHTSTMALKDYILGRPIELDDYTWDNLLGLFGLSRFVIRTGANEGPVAGLEALLMPPVRPIDEVFRDTTGIFQGKRQSFEDFRSIRYIPVAGKFLYWRWGHGAQKVKKKKEKEQNKEKALVRR